VNDFNVRHQPRNNNNNNNNTSRDAETEHTTKDTLTAHARTHCK